MKLSQEIRQSPTPTPDQLLRWINYAELYEEIVDAAMAWKKQRATLEEMKKMLGPVAQLAEQSTDNG